MPRLLAVQKITALQQSVKTHLADKIGTTFEDDRNWKITHLADKIGTKFERWQKLENEKNDKIINKKIAYDRFLVRNITFMESSKAGDQNAYKQVNKQ